MNKSAPEYIKVREQIAKMLFDDFIKDYPIDGIGSWETISEKRKEKHLIHADSILEIKGIAILADSQTLPDYPASNLQDYDADEVDNKCLTTQIKMLGANFKKVVE